MLIYQYSIIEPAHDYLYRDDQKTASMHEAYKIKNCSDMYLQVTHT